MLKCILSLKFEGNKSYDNSVKLKRTEVELELSLNGPQPELDKRKLS